ncbi:hypothetical protein CRE_28551 [Caenorhabditis remanei]|uniref:Uncharacterized protein n=1 Tax=Caenorhabditis remanei TaxID=31234 RepID=E3LMZ9_CAERE|nr:hypothetical protein CRE_28551 [Caenorhabditis remanei]
MHRLFASRRVTDANLVRSLYGSVTTLFAIGRSRTTRIPHSHTVRLWMSNFAIDCARTARIRDRVRMVYDVLLRDSDCFRKRIVYG